MIDLLPFVSIFIAGAVLGAFYFSGLFITVKLGVAHKFCAPLFLTSFLVRFLVFISLLIIVLSLNPHGVIPLLAGMLTVRGLYLFRAQREGNGVHEAGGQQCI